MADNELRIEPIRAKDLVIFAEKIIAEAVPGQFIPITMQRAVAHTRNPFIAPDDVCLLVAFYEQICVGFFGIMPIMLKNREKSEKIYWFTTWRVSPELRGKSLGSLLMQEALKLNQDYMIVGSRPARKVCRRFGFWEREPLVYYELDLSGMQRLNPARWASRILRKLLHPLNIKVNINNKITRFVGDLLKPIGKSFFMKQLWRNQEKLLKEVFINEVERIQPETPAQLANLPDTHLLRDSSIINWMLEYPWVVESGNSPSEQMDYYFSDARPLFRNLVFEIRSMNGNYIGYLLLMISEAYGIRELKILDYLFGDRAYEKYILPIAAKYASQFRVDNIIMPAEAIQKNQNDWLMNAILHEKHRIYQCYPKDPNSFLAKNWKDIHFRYCDGDMGFS